MTFLIIMHQSSNGSSNGSDTPYETNVMEKEVSLFRAEDQLDHNIDHNMEPQWWQLNSHRFPHLAKLA